jgi:hypothetical protein
LCACSATETLLKLGGKRVVIGVDAAIDLRPYDRRLGLPCFDEIDLRIVQEILAQCRQVPTGFDYVEYEDGRICYF